MKSRIYICCLFLLSGIGNTFSQARWDSLFPRIDSYNQAIDVIYADSNYLYIAGGFHIIDGQHMQGIARWNGIKWDSMGAGIDRLIQYDSLPNMNPENTLAMTTYHHKLYVGGEFSSVGYINAPGIGTWNGTAWDSMKIQPLTFMSNSNIPTGSVFALAVINNMLYVGGDFDTVAGKPCIGIACWNDTNWSTLNFPNLSVFSYIDAICEYQGSIYVGGLFSGSNNGNIDNIYRWDSTGWHTLNPGIPGSLSDVWSMAVYNGELYVGGEFTTSDGNFGNNIEKWNGTSWSEVSGGTDHQVYNLFVYNGKLYAMGIFTEAGGVAAHGIAEWDGIKWCSFAGYIDNNLITSACLYHDSLYIGGNFAINDTITDLAEWVGGNYTDSCENTTGIDRVKNESAEVKVYPNPSDGQFTLLLSNVNSAYTIEIYNILGEKVYTETFPQSQNDKTINLKGQPNGVYFYRIITQTGSLIGEGKIVVQ